MNRGKIIPRLARPNLAIFALLLGGVVPSDLLRVQLAARLPQRAAAVRKVTCPVFRRFVDPGLFSDPRLERALCGAKPRAPRPAAVARPAAYTVDDGVAAATLKQDLEGGVSAAPARGWRRWGAGSFFTAHFLASAAQVFSGSCCARHRWVQKLSLTCRHPATTTRSLPQTERRKIDHARSGRMVSSRPSAKPLI